MTLLFTPHLEAQYLHDYTDICEEINTAVSEENQDLFLHLMQHWAREDLFFLLYFILRVNVNHPWLVERIKEVQTLNDRTLDLWAREHFKSSILTYGLNIQTLLKNPEPRLGIFSHTRSIAKSFLRRIKHTFESNQVLKAVFPEVAWESPQTEAPKWSEDEGIVLRRQGVYQEASVEAWGLVDGMPTGKHFDVLNYDDVVTRESVTTPEQIAKVDECFRLSLNLGADDLLGGTQGVRRVIGTIYHFNDLYMRMQKEGGWVLRKHPAINEEKNPVLLSQGQLDAKRRDMGPYVFSCQLLLDPREQGKQKFLYKWIQFYREAPSPVSKYLFVDPATSKKEKASGSDYTVLWVWGIDERGNRFWLDGTRSRLSLTERWTTVKAMLRKHPDILKVGYERYGMQADVEYFRAKMEEESFYFPIQELGGAMRKEDRILRMVPWFEQGRVFLPHHLQLEDGRDLVQEFINEEYLFFPFSPHDDMMDCMSRIEDVDFITSRPITIPEDGVGGEVADLGWYRLKKGSRFANL